MMTEQELNKLKKPATVSQQTGTKQELTAASDTNSNKTAIWVADFEML